MLRIPVVGLQRPTRSERVCYPTRTPPRPEQVIDLPDEDGLSGAEMVLLIEALDDLIPFREETAYVESLEVRERWTQYCELRRRLKDAVHMSFYSTANGWLDDELRRERVALTDALHTRLAALIRDPNANRRSVRHGFVAAVQELRERRQSTPRPLS